MFQTSTTYTPHKTKMTITPDMSNCQRDYPIDCYPEHFIPYAEEY